MSQLRQNNGVDSTTKKAPFFRRAVIDSNSAPTNWFQAVRANTTRLIYSLVWIRTLRSGGYYVVAVHANLRQSSAALIYADIKAASPPATGAHANTVFTAWFYGCRRSHLPRLVKPATCTGVNVRARGACTLSQVFTGFVFWNQIK